MKQLVGLIGITLMAFSSMTYYVSIKAGVCLAIFIFAGGLFIDALKK